jgi:hypothetical protein
VICDVMSKARPVPRRLKLSRNLASERNEPQILAPAAYKKGKMLLTYGSVKIHAHSTFGHSLSQSLKYG